MSTDEISNRRCTWLLNQRAFRYWREADIGQIVNVQRRLEISSVDIRPPVGILPVDAICATC
jgi:hypothetical protein